MKCILLRCITWVMLLLLLCRASSYIHVEARGDGVNKCFRPALNRRNLDEVVDTYHSLLKIEKFIGQDEAVRVVRDKLIKYVVNMQRLLMHSQYDKQEQKKQHSNFLSFHFVGATGTGKSFLAEILARSLFHQYDCQGLGFILSKFVHCEKMGIPLQSWLMMCGTIRTAFLENEEDQGRSKMDATLMRAAEMLRYNEREGIILVFDDFNFCTGECEKKMIEFIEKKELVTAQGHVIDASRVILILTSDLSREGILLPDGINDQKDFDYAKNVVLNAARKRWNEKDEKIKYFFNASTMIPFVQLSVSEIRKLLSNEFEHLENKVRKQIENAFKNQMDSEKLVSNKKYPYAMQLIKRVMDEISDESHKYIWKGKFYYHEDIIDELLSKCDVTGNGRMITVDIKPKLEQLLVSPADIGKLLIEKGNKINLDENNNYQSEAKETIIPNDIVMKISSTKTKNGSDVHPLDSLYLEIVPYSQ